MSIYKGTQKISGGGGGSTIIQGEKQGVKCIPVTITTDLWQDITNPYFNCEAIIPIAEMVHTDHAFFMLDSGPDMENAAAAEDAGVSTQQETVDGGHKVYCKNKPNVDITGTLIVFDGLGTLRTVIGENLLINTNFKNPINQRGKTTYRNGEFDGVFYEDEYSIDHWMISGFGEFSVTQNGMVIQLTMIDPYSTLTQYLEPKSVDTSKSIIASVCIDNDVYVTPAIVLDKENLNYDAGVCKFFINKTQNNYVEFTIVLRDTQPHTVQWAKMEYGTEATPFVPSDYLLELIKCKRYLHRVWQSLGGTMIYDSTRNTLTGNVYFPVNMRTIPTILDITYKNQNTGAFGAIENAKVTCNDLCLSSLWDLDPINATNGQYLEMTFIADAEIYTQEV